MRYQKVVTTVFTNGKTSTEKRGTIAEELLADDVAAEATHLRRIAQTGPVGRILTVEQCGDTNIVMVYDTGLTKVFNWVAVTE